MFVIEEQIHQKYKKRYLLLGELLFLVRLVITVVMIAQRRTPPNNVPNMDATFWSVYALCNGNEILTRIIKILMKWYCFVLTIFIRLDFLTKKKKIDSSLPKIISTKFCQSHGSTEKGHSHENKILKRTDRQMAVHV